MLLRISIFGSMDYSNYSNEHLLVLLSQSDSKSFEEIYKRFWKQCYKYAITKVAENTIAEDICHDIFLTIWQRRASIVINNLEAYLIQSVKYSILKVKLVESKSNYLQKNYRSRENFNEIEYNVFFNELNKVWKQGISTLPEKSREVYLLSRVENFSNKEIAEMLSITEKGVEYHIGKCIKFFKVYLKDYIISLLFVSIKILENLLG